MQISLEDLTATECVELYRNRHASPVEVVDDCLRRIESVNPLLNAFCFVGHEQAKQSARESEARWMRGEPTGPLDGVPATIKELTLTRGMPTLRGSAAVDPDGPWDVDSPIAARMREAGAVFLGKTTSPEFGWKGVTDSVSTALRATHGILNLHPVVHQAARRWQPRLTLASFIKEAMEVAQSEYRRASREHSDSSRPLATSRSGLTAR